MVKSSHYGLRSPSLHLSFPDSNPCRLASVTSRVLVADNSLSGGGVAEWCFEVGLSDAW